MSNSQSSPQTPPCVRVIHNDDAFECIFNKFYNVSDSQLIKYNNFCDEYVNDTISVMIEDTNNKFKTRFTFSSSGQKALTILLKKQQYFPINEVNSPFNSIENMEYWN